MGDVAIDLTASDGGARGGFDADRLQRQPVRHLNVVLSRNAFEAFCETSAQNLCGSSSVREFAAALVLLLELQASIAQEHPGRGRQRGSKKRKTSTKKTARGFVSGTGYGGSNSTDKQTTAARNNAIAGERQADARLQKGLEDFHTSLKIAVGTTLDSHDVLALAGLMVMPLSQVREILARATSTLEGHSDTGAAGAANGRQKKERQPQRRNGGTKRTKRKRTEEEAQQDSSSGSLVSLLRTLWLNDSTMDVLARQDLYDALLGLTTEIGLAPLYTGLPGLLARPQSADDKEAEGSAIGDDDVIELGSDESDDGESQGHDFSTMILAYISKLNSQGKLLLAEQGVASVNTFEHLAAFIARIEGDISLGNGEISTDTCTKTNDLSLSLLENVSNAFDQISQHLQSHKYYKTSVAKILPVKKSTRRNLLRNGAVELDNEKRKKLYVEILKDIQFRSVSILDLAQTRPKPTVKYHFLPQALQWSMANAANRQRMLRISREVSTLRTSLPLSWGSGVFARVDENRHDVLSILILGPADTPYANGAFLFDFYFPSNYPTKPPLAIFKTTGGGTVRFNPNLYADGKVCLSLLGTWSGPGWIPGTSTLLQVLISIQALILVEEPYFNEPGYENTMGTEVGKQASETYNFGIRSWTLRWGILDMINNPPYLFKDVLEAHFSLKKQDIIDQCSQWLESGQRTADSNPKNLHVVGCGDVSHILGPMKDSVVKINAALDKLGANSASSSSSGTTAAIAITEEDDLPTSVLDTEPTATSLVDKDEDENCISLVD